jgi:hypothetical protein
LKQKTRQPLRWQDGHVANTLIVFAPQSPQILYKRRRPLLRSAEGTGYRSQGRLILKRKGRSSPSTPPEHDSVEQGSTHGPISRRSGAISAIGLSLVISWFPTSQPQGPAIGDQVCTTWGEFCGVIQWYRREDDEKDGPNFIPARFQLESDDKHVRRLGQNLIARTAVAMDIEANKKTGELPPGFAAAVRTVRQSGWAGIVYTSHNHLPRSPRYRIVLPLSAEIEHGLPAVEIMADQLGLSSVFDASKRNASSLFYLPSCPHGRHDQHDVATIGGDPIDAAWIREVAGKLLTERQTEHDRIAAEARAQAEAWHQAKIAAGFDPDDSLIEKVRSRLDLGHILLAHGYDKRGDKYRHPNSTSGSYGADIKTFAGIERIYSHNANDPLHCDNLPSWCGGVTALDAVDVLIILDYGGDRKRALHDMAERYGLTKPKEWRAIAGLIFRLIREQAPQEKIETVAYAEGIRQGLAPDEVYAIACWVTARYQNRKSA